MFSRGRAEDGHFVHDFRARAAARRALGYEETGIEGFVPTERVAGSIVLFRVSRAYGEGYKDREHRFVVDPDELERLRKLGWSYDGSKGFVYPVP